MQLANYITASRLPLDAELWLDCEECLHVCSAWGQHKDRVSIPVTGALMEYSASLTSGLLAIKGLAGSPQLASKCSSTRSTPHTTRLMSLPDKA